jgi:cytidylate kinase
MASLCSAYAFVRKKLVATQRKMGETKSIIMDGRDIGTNVLAGAEYKFFVTASPDERAKRRQKRII